MRHHWLLTTRRWAVPLSTGPSSSTATLAEQAPRASRSVVTNAGFETAAATSTSTEDQPELVRWVLNAGGKVQGATLANLAGRDGGSGWGLKASQVGSGTCARIL